MAADLARYFPAAQLGEIPPGHPTKVPGLVEYALRRNQLRWAQRQ